MPRVVHGAGEYEAPLEDGEDLVGDRRGSSCEVSARFFATYAGGYAVWLLYGLSIGSLPLILVDAAGLLCGLITLAITLSMRGPILRPSSWGTCPERLGHGVDAASGDPAPAAG
ncbi:MAG TPA: hypothetical protein VE270_12215 [Thermoleophilaceae bacterium]|nr:hypothetical protein [Thermoleophilaceae bacterium]